MPTPNSSVGILTGQGATIAAQTVAAKSYQAVVITDTNGNFLNEDSTTTNIVHSYKSAGNATTGLTIGAFTSNYTGRTIIRRVGVQMDGTGAVTSPNAYAQLRRISAVSGGVLIPITGSTIAQWGILDTSLSTGLLSNYTFRGAASSDWGASSNIISGSLSGIIRQSILGRMHTAVGWVPGDENQIWPATDISTPLVLASGESICIVIQGQAAASIPTSYFYYTNIAFDVI